MIDILAYNSTDLILRRCNSDHCLFFDHFSVMYMTVRLVVNSVLGRTSSLPGTSDTNPRLVGHGMDLKFRYSYLLQFHMFIAGYQKKKKISDKFLASNLAPEPVKSNMQTLEGRNTLTFNPYNFQTD